MSHDIGGALNFHAVLLELDRRAEAQVRAAGCPHCGGPLYAAHHPRKARGVSEVGVMVRRRLKRTTPRNRGVVWEREKGFEPSTSTLARLHSTTELLPQRATGCVGLNHSPPPVKKNGRAG